MRSHTLAQSLSFGVPLIAYVWTASGHAYWLDSGEFVAAAVQLDIAHPPGHPLSQLFGHIWCLLPLGSLSFRVALGQALAGALASWLHCRASAAAFSGFGLRPRLVWSLATLASWLGALSYALWFQAVRPEVYALQTLCMAIVFERLSSLLARGPEPDARPLLGAAVALGLGLANHHLIAFLVAPAFLPALVRTWHGRRVRSFVSALVLGLSMLATYLYLPLRAAAHPPANLGSPDTLQRFWWVVSARVYAREMGSEAPESFATRGLDVIALFAENLGPLALVFAVLGAYLMLRHRGTRSHGVLCLLLLGVDGGTRAWLGAVRANPDILGYLAPSFLALGTLAAGGLAAFAWLLVELQPKAAKRIEYAALIAPAAALLLLPSSASRASLRDFCATDAFDEQRVRNLPPRAVVLAASPQTVFRTWDLAAVEDVRPDVLMLPLPFLRYPGTSEALLRRAPEIAPLLRAYLGRHDHLDSPELQRMAELRPVFVELDTRVSIASYGLLRPRGLLAQVTQGGSFVSASALGAELATLWQTLDRRLGADAREVETARQLLWVHYMNAVQLGVLGARPQAAAELRRALVLVPSEHRARALAEALAQPGAFDPRPFLAF